MQLKLRLKGKSVDEDAVECVVEGYFWDWRTAQALGLAIRAKGGYLCLCGR